MALAMLRSCDVMFKPHGALCQEKRSLVYSNVLAEALGKLGIQYEHCSYTYTSDLTDCLKNNFQSPVQKNILDFIAHVKLEHYPESVTKTLIAYLDSICHGRPEKALLDITVDVFCISKIF